jgi:6-phosphogluconate dehydrogenase (decarboxylating)
VFDQNSAAIKALVGERVAGATDLKQLVGQLDKPRAVWVMLPAGEITESTIAQLGALLDPGDTIIDGGNSFYKDDIRRAKSLKAKGIQYVDCGTSGGVWGLDRGYCLMIGGDKEAVDLLDPIFNTLAPGVPRAAGIARASAVGGRGRRRKIGATHHTDLPGARQQPQCRIPGDRRRKTGSCRTRPGRRLDDTRDHGSPRRASPLVYGSRRGTGRSELMSKEPG